MKLRILAFLSVFAISSVWAQDQNQGFGLQNTQMVVKLLSPVSTKTAQEGYAFTAVVEQPPEYQGGIVEGRITHLKRPEKGTGKGKAEIQFQFETLTFKNRTEHIRADLKDVMNSQGKRKVDEEGNVIGVTSNKKRALFAALGAAAGAATGAAVGGGRGAVVGAAAGGAAGLILGLKMTTAASDIEFKPGSLFTLMVSDIQQ